MAACLDMLHSVLALSAMPADLQLKEHMPSKDVTAESRHEQMKGKFVLQVPHFPFPTPPETEALLAAQKCLVSLSALHPASHPSTPLGLTALGRAMSHYPITPRHARMLLQVC